MNWQPFTSNGPGAYSRAIRAGDFIYVSGHIPVDASGDIIGANYAEQTVIVIDRLEEALKIAGASLSDVVSMTCYLADINNWDEFNEAYKKRMPQPYPTRTTVGAQLHGCLVEISAIAYLPA